MATKRKRKTRTKKKPAEPTPSPEKAKNVQDAIAKAVRAKYGVEAAKYLGAGEAVLSEVSEVISTGVEVIDHWVLSIGGYAVGRIIEMGSEEGGGKTTLGWTSVRECQRDGGVAAWIDSEHAFDAGRGKELGADPSKMVVLEPSTLEEAVGMVWIALLLLPQDPKGGPNLIVWDSVGATPPAKELAGEEMGMGEFARIMTRNLKKIPSTLKKKRTVLLCINQVRENLGGFGGGLITPGGRYFHHAASVRMMLWGGAKVEDRLEDIIAKDITVNTLKNRFGPPRKARVRLSFESGWDSDWSTIEHAKNRALIGERRRKGRKTLAEAREKLGWPIPPWNLPTE